MPYDHIEELPAAMRKNLPIEAMEVYMAAFNLASTGTGRTVQDRAHREAWKAVRDKFHKRGEEWLRNYT